MREEFHSINHVTNMITELSWLRVQEHFVPQTVEICVNDCNAAFRYFPSYCNLYCVRGAIRVILRSLSYMLSENVIIYLVMCKNLQHSTTYLVNKQLTCVVFRSPTLLECNNFNLEEGARE